LVLWRNNVGVARRTGPRGTTATRYGLVTGASDLIGILTVGELGRFVAIEVKRPRGRVSAAQQLFLDLVRSHGGFAAVVRSVDDARAGIARARMGARQ